ncbi:MAG: serine hydrolase domain-containing protein, partial [Bacteroidota bacterium]
MKHPIIFLLIVLPLLLSLYACDKENDLQIPDTIASAEALKEALEAIHKASDVPGFTIAIAKEDAMIYQESFGQADVQANKAYTNQTIQPIGSISKTFVAAAVVKAIEEGYFTLETPINDLLPFEIKHPDDPDAVIQIKHLVTHTSGLLDHPNFYLQSYHILAEEDLGSDGAKIMQESFGIRQRETIPLGDYLKSYYWLEGSHYDVENFGAIGTWRYSNIATSLAAYLVEIATETPFQTYVITKILRPLGMYQTAYQISNLDTSLVAKLYWDTNTPLPR